VWMPFSHAPAGVDQKFFISIANFENGHLAIWLMNLMKIRLENRELGENQKMMNREKSKTWWKSDVKSRTWWKSVIRSSLGCKFRMHLLTGIKFFSSVWQISKAVILLSFAKACAFFDFRPRTFFGPHFDPVNHQKVIFCYCLSPRWNDLYIDNLDDKFSSYMCNLLSQNSL
jgi:hypothetical protein